MNTVQTRGGGRYPIPKQFATIHVGGKAKAHIGDVINVGGLTQEDVRREEHAKCLRSFKSVPYEQHKDVNATAEPGTCLWAAEHQQFRSWHSSSHNDLLWISADPGCGKSVLSKYLVDVKLQNGATTVCYFFFKDNQEQSTLPSALCAILHRLFLDQPHLLEAHAMDLWRTHGDRIMKETSKLWQILMAASADSKAKPIICVLDALDECSDHDRRALITLLCHFYGQTDRDSASLHALKFLVTSRPYDSVQRWFQDTTSAFPQIRLRGEDENDTIHQEIDKVIKVRVKEIGNEFTLSLASLRNLEQRLLGMQNRTYLWLYLAIEHIREAYLMSLDPDGKVDIEILPSSVEDAYEVLLSRVSSQRRPIVQRIFCIMLGARRPLSIDALATAMAVSMHQDRRPGTRLRVNVKHFQQYVREWCGLFVFVRDSVLYLIHQTAKEFLTTPEPRYAGQEDRWKGCLAQTNLATELAHTTMDYLQMNRFEPRFAQKHLSSTVVQSNLQFVMSAEQLHQREGVEEGKDFLIYAAEHWRHHLQEACLSRQENALLDQAVQLCDMRSSACHTWIGSFWKQSSRTALQNTLGITVNDVNHGVAPAHVAIACGLDHVVEHLIERKSFDMEARDHAGRTPLTWAIGFNRSNCIRLLLQNGANVNHCITIRRGVKAQTLTMFYLAIRSTSEILKMILEANARTDEQHLYEEQPLVLAVKLNNPEKVALLIKHGADALERDNTGQTPLNFAAGTGRLRVVKTILANGVSINGRGRQGRVPLHKAAKLSHATMTQLLLSHHADINIEDDHGQTPLHLAAATSSVLNIELLLKSNAPVMPADLLGNTPLHLAVSRNTRTPNVSTNEVSSAKNLADQTEELAKDMVVKSVEALVTAGHSIEVCNRHGETPLHSAARSNSTTGVQLLLGKNANVNCSNNDQDSPLHFAVSVENSEMVELLLAAGADINAQDLRGNTPLHVAVEVHSYGLCRLLLNKGANMNVQGGPYRWTPLISASIRDHDDLVQLLLGRNARTDLQTIHKENALDIAILHDKTNLVYILAKAGAKPSRSDTSSTLSKLFKPSSGTSTGQLQPRQSTKKIVLRGKSPTGPPPTVQPEKETAEIIEVASSLTS